MVNIILQTSYWTCVNSKINVTNGKHYYFGGKKDYTVVCSSLGTQVQKEKTKSLNKEQTTTPQALNKPWCGLHLN